MATYTWRSNSGDFATASNWSGDVVPGLTDTAVFGAGSGTIGGSGSVRSLLFVPGGPWTGSGLLTTGSVAVDGTAALTGSAAWTVTGAPVGGAIVVGDAQGGSASLLISGGAQVMSTASYGAGGVALALATAPGTTATLTIDGIGSELVVNGVAVIGGTETESGVLKGGTATVTVTNFGTLQTGALTVEAGSTLSTVGGGNLRSGSLKATSLTIDGGTVVSDFLPVAPISFGNGGTLVIAQVISQIGTVANFSYGDEIDFPGSSSILLRNNVLVEGHLGFSGSINLGPPPAGGQYQLFSDGIGGVFATVTPNTVGVYRFFDTTNGTHFSTADANEAATIKATRPDLVPEGVNGIGFKAVSSDAGDPNASMVYRFFDVVDGTHFYTASATERDQVIATRPDLQYEPNSGFYEHKTQEPGDTPVYRFFDSVHGTHFYSDGADEVASIKASRPDLIYDGVAFYEPSPQKALATNST